MWCKASCEWFSFLVFLGYQWTRLDHPTNVESNPTQVEREIVIYTRKPPVTTRNALLRVHNLNRWTSAEYLHHRNFHIISTRLHRDLKKWNQQSWVPPKQSVHSLAHKAVSPFVQNLNIELDNIGPTLFFSNQQTCWSSGPSCLVFIF